MLEDHIGKTGAEINALKLIVTGLKALGKCEGRTSVDLLKYEVWLDERNDFVEDLKILARARGLIYE